jgi:5'-nucleotidase
MIGGSGLPAVCANLRTSEGGDRVSWCEPWRVVEVAGLRVAIVGLLTPTTPTITHPDAARLHYQEPAEALTEVRSALAGEVDWVLPVTHLGVRDDRRLAKAHPDLPVVVGGHSHTYLREGVRQGETLVLQAGSKGSAVGRLDLWFDAGTRALVETRYQVVDLLEEPAEADRNPRVEERCAELVRRGEAAMGAVVGELAEPLERHFRLTHSSPAGNLITDVMRSRFEADVAVQNRGGIRCDLPAGEVTRRGLFELLPFGNHLVLLELDGGELFELLRASVEGTAHTGLEVSGLTVLWSAGEGPADGPRLEGLEVAGEPVDPARTYRVVTNNFLAGGGDGYALLGEQEVVREDPMLLRELLEQHFREAGTVRLVHDDRYREVKP